MAVMTIDDALKQILSRANDPFGDTYWLRAYQLFFEGINTLVQTGDYIPEEIPSMIKITPKRVDNLNTEDTLVWSPPAISENDLFGGFVIKIIDIREDIPDGITATNIGVRFKEIDNQYYQLLKYDTEYKPLNKEIFYMIEGKSTGTFFAGEVPDVEAPHYPSVEYEHSISIKFISLKRLRRLLDKIEIKYIASPIPAKFNVSNPKLDAVVEPTRIDQMFSLPFVYRVIDFAVQKLAMEAFD